MMAEFDSGFNPMSIMTVLQALWWAIPAWNVDLKSETIQCCFKQALSMEDAAEMKDQELLNKLQQGLQKLQFANNIQEAMDINQSLNPQDEQMNDNSADIDDIILSQFAATRLAKPTRQPKDHPAQPGYWAGLGHLGMTRGPDQVFIG